jgi:hypothetical protein
MFAKASISIFSAVSCHDLNLQVHWQKNLKNAAFILQKKWNKLSFK